MPCAGRPRAATKRRSRALCSVRQRVMDWTRLAAREPRSQLPRDALGLGLRPAHYDYLFEHWPSEIGYLEIITENFLGDAAPPARNLARVQARYPVVLHGVGL